MLITAKLQEVHLDSIKEKDSIYERKILERKSNSKIEG